jgi:hypothetical protein
MDGVVVRACGRFGGRGGGVHASLSRAPSPCEAGERKKKSARLEGGAGSERRVTSDECRSREGERTVGVVLRVHSAQDVAKLVLGEQPGVDGEVDHLQRELIQTQRGVTFSHALPRHLVCGQKVQRRVVAVDAFEHGVVFAPQLQTGAVHHLVHAQRARVHLQCAVCIHSDAREHRTHGAVYATRCRAGSSKIISLTLASGPR